MKTAQWLLKISFPLSISLFSSAAGPLDFFQFHDVSPPAGGLYSITFADDRFVAVGGRVVGTHQSAIVVSVDGESWNLQGPTVNSILYGVTHGPGLFVAVGESGAILNSADGRQWTNVSLGRAMTLRAVTFGAGRYVAVGDNGAVAISTNGVAWTIRNAFSAQFTGIAYGNGVFVAIGDSSVLTSPDGLTWTRRAVVLPLAGRVVFGNGHFLAGGVGSNIWISEDGVKWKSVPTAYLGSPALGVSPGKFLVFGESFVLLSSDIEAWSQVAFSKLRGSSIAAVAFGNGKHVAVGHSSLSQRQPTILVSPDGVQWSSVGLGRWTSAFLNAPSVYEIIYAQGRFFGVGDLVSSAGEGLFLGVLSSIDGITWDTLEPGASAVALTGMAYGNDRFIALGASRSAVRATSISVFDSNAVWGSTLNLPLGKLTFGKDQFVGVGTNGTIATSPDGFVWSQAQSPVTNRLKSVTFGADQFVAVGDAGAILLSTDGMSWTKEESGTSNSLEGATYGKGLFVVVGSAGTVLVSADARQWTRQNSRAITALRSVCFGNDLFVAVGDAGTVLLSSNGAEWTRKVYSAAGNFFSVASGNGKFIAVGTSIYQADLTPGVLAQPSFTSAGVSLQVSGKIGTVYHVEASATLQPDDWAEIGAVTNTSLTMPLVDLPKSRTRFYRMVAQP